MTTHSNSKRILLSLGALGAAGAIAGLGTFATFTDTTSASQQVTAGTVNINLGTADSTANRFNVVATGVVPGDTIQRNIDLINAGNQDLASITLTSAATISSLLNTDVTNGLQIVVQDCSVPWTQGGATSAPTYTCSGTTSGVLASRAVIGTTLALTNLGSLTNGVTDHLLFTLTLPTTADNTFQAATSTIDFTFDAIQRTATAR